MITIENLDKDRVPNAWVSQEVIVETRGPVGEVAELIGKLEDVHEGGIVLSRTGPTPRAEAEPGLARFYPWSSVEVLRLRALTDRPGTRREGSNDDADERAGGSVPYSQRFGRPITSRALEDVVPIAQRTSVAGIAITLRSLEVYEGGHGLIGYLVYPEPGNEHLPPRYSFPEVRVRDDQGRPYETHVGNVHRGSSGELWLASLPEADDAERLEVEVIRLFGGPTGAGRVEYLDGPWVFRFPLRRT